MGTLSIKARLALTLGFMTLLMAGGGAVGSGAMANASSEVEARIAAITQTNDTIFQITPKSEEVASLAQQSAMATQLQSVAMQEVAASMEQLSALVAKTTPAPAKPAIPRRE